MLSKRLLEFFPIRPNSVGRLQEAALVKLNQGKLVPVW
jgi:hypothetical protein